MIDIIAEIESRFNKSESETLYRELANIIVNLIDAGVLNPTDRLPAIRKLAKHLGVNNITVVNAYKRLESKRYAHSIKGSGTYVSERLQGFFAQPQPIHTDEAFEQTQNSSSGELINFANSNTSSDLFPVDEFKKLFNRVLDRDMGDAFGYSEKQGYLPLREVLCEYIAGFGIKNSAENMQIISGAQQGVDIISKAILLPDDAVIVESPTYHGAVASFLSRGAVVAGVPIEPGGMDIPRLESVIKNCSPRLLYIMPYFQTPTCYSYSMEKKRLILDLAAKYNFYIIEEDNQSDFNYSTDPVVPLKTLDYRNRVIYIKSFSKILMPGLRLGFMVLPKAVLKQIVAAKFSADIDTSGFIQRAFELFIKSGEWGTHILKMKEVYRERYSYIIEAAGDHFKKSMKFITPEGGLNLWVKLPDGTDVTSFCQKLLENGVVVTPGELFSQSVGEPNIRLSFANLQKNEIKQGIKIIGKVAAEFF